MNNPNSELMSVNAQKIYCNGFSIGMTATEAFVVYKFNGMDNIMISMPFAVAKELGEKLGTGLEQYSQTFGVEIVTVEELTKRADEIK